MAKKKHTYDNQPSLARVKERLKGDGWSADRLANAEFHTVVQDRVSGSGNPYFIEVLGVFEANALVLAFSVTRNNRMFKDDAPGGTKAAQDTFVDGEDARVEQKTQKEEKRSQDHAKANEKGLLNDLVNAMTTGLDGYPKTWGTLQYFWQDRKGNRKRYPSKLGAEFLVENDVPIIWNPTNKDNWTQAQQDALANTKTRKECEARQELADNVMKIALDLLAKMEITAEHYSQVDVDAGIYVTTGEWPRRFDPIEGIDGTLIPSQETDMPVQNPDPSDGDAYDNKPTKIKDLSEQKDSDSESEARADSDDEDALALLGGTKPQDDEKVIWDLLIESSDGNGHDFGILEDIHEAAKNLNITDVQRHLDKVVARRLITVYDTEYPVSEAEPVTQFTFTDDGFRKAGLEEYVEAPAPVPTPSRGISVMDD